MSSSEDENTEHLLECIDQSFFPCNIKTGDVESASTRVSTESDVLEKSHPGKFSKSDGSIERRHIFDFDSKDDNLPFGLPLLEPGAQVMLSKALQKKLDKDLEFDASEDSSPTVTNSEPGIRLFRQSEDFVQSTSNVVEHQVVQTKPNLTKTRRRLLESDPDEKVDFTSIAVSPEWVLEKRGVYGNGRERQGELITGAVHSQLVKRCKL